MKRTENSWCWRRPVLQGLRSLSATHWEERRLLSLQEGRCHVVREHTRESSTHPSVQSKPLSRKELVTKDRQEARGGARSHLAQTFRLLFSSIGRRGQGFVCRADRQFVLEDQFLKRKKYQCDHFSRKRCIIHLKETQYMKT